MSTNVTAKKRVFPVKAFVFGFAYVFTVAILFSAVFFEANEFDTYKPLRLMIIFFASTLLAKYFFYMIVSPLESIRSTYSKLYWKKQRPYYYPKVTVMVPAWNEEVGIITTLNSLIASSYNNLEIVVVNDGSVDNSHTLIQEFVSKFKQSKEAKLGKTVVYQYKDNGGKGAALNTAIELASGEIIVSIDADCIVDKNAIAAFVEYFRNPNTMAAVGNVKVGNASTLLGTIQQLEFLFSFYFKKADSFMNTIYIIGGAAGAFRRNVFDDLGSYQTGNITEDIELSMRIQDAGMRIVYASDALVYTEGASDLAGLKKQRLRWKRGRFQTFYEYWYMFVSLRMRHNKLLSWVILPLALFAEVQLLFELPFLAFLYVYSFIANDFSSFISGIIVVSSMFFFQVVFEDKSTRRFSFYALAPIAWFLFYIMTYVEASALKNAIVGALRGEQVGWQRWDRKGVSN